MFMNEIDQFFSFLHLYRDVQYIHTIGDHVNDHMLRPCPFRPPDSDRQPFSTVDISKNSGKSWANDAKSRPIEYHFPAAKAKGWSAHDIWQKERVEENFATAHGLPIPVL
jgi:hypothetical protein